MNSQAVAIVSIALLMLFGAFVVPTLMDSTETPQTFETRLEPGMTEEVTDGLELAVNETGNNEATIVVTDTQTDQEERLVIAQGTTEQYDLPGGSGNITAVETTNQAATLDVTYDPMYGWSAGAQAIVDNIDIILVMLMFLVLMGGLKVVVS